MKITIGSDHRGYDLKSKIIKHFSDIEWIDVGTDSEQKTDYPIFAKKVCKNVQQNNVDLGILICGSGIGISIAANRFAGIYAALCWNEEVAQNAKEHDKANVLVLPSDYVGYTKAIDMVENWLCAQFKGGRYQDRLTMIDKD